MAHTAAHILERSFATSHGALSSLFSAFESFGASRRRAKAIAELNDLSDITLRDIGIERDAIPAAVDGALARTTRF